MTVETNDRPPGPPRVAFLLPIVLVLHQADEWFGGFPEWTTLAFDDGVEPGQFLLINSIGFLLITFWTLAAFRVPEMAWIVVSFAALLGLNGALHALASVLVDRYSPGTATGLLLSIPLSLVILRSSARVIPRRQFFGAILAGFLLHGVVTFLALA
jgi:hypothetical protein